jgi:hypothetical protein
MINKLKMNDFREEIAMNILNEIDDKMINYYFANSHIFENNFETKVSNLLFARNNPQFFQEGVLDKASFISKMDNNIQAIHDEMFFEISREMTKKRSEIFWDTLSQRNPIFTIQNPFFVCKALDTTEKDLTFHNWLGINLTHR